MMMAPIGKSITKPSEKTAKRILRQGGYFFLWKQKRIIKFSRNGLVINEMIHIRNIEKNNTFVGKKGDRPNK